ncbi:DUF3034 family protein [Colwellia sp. MB3u-70]|uniref:DUF3034 family protein n=1 Tax=unclassified Colwellia TaxID=196834 RepID=UPI0015F76B84|nr:MULTISPECIES: DUF3034 family protein [unclassified Colwellia]MBA6293898.1 DUF3034 family protein [Colwellia sp. MB3u-8]MBA6306846.1 DUF3034 family protein [Colwellia sp. MB3u-70]
MNKISPLLYGCFLVLCSANCSAEGKILATPGVSQIEGSGGGGIVPWAQLAGYATEESISVSAACSRVTVKDFSLDSCALQANLYDKIELSYAKQNFEVTPLKLNLKQNIIGAKINLFGDLVYSTMPQVSLGIQSKKLKTSDVAFSLGAKKDTGTDVYIAASKLHLGFINGYNWLWNVTARHTKSNQLGLLGFGGAHEKKTIQLEVSSAILLNRHLALGVEFRQKPDNLNLGEDHWKDIFIAWFPNKHLSVTLAYVDLGSIAAIDKQTGWYLSTMWYL